MSHLATLMPDTSGPISPLLDRLSRELDGPSSAPGEENRPQGNILSELLEYAAAAEQQLADQRRRIAYLEGLSMTDELTGLANRRGFEQFLGQALSAARRHEESGVIGFFDLDDFKTLNDALGHEAGDAALAHVGTVLAEGVRSFDCAARLGGDEFAVVLVRCKPVAAARRLRLLQEAIARTPFIHRSERFTLSASLGIRPFNGGCESRELLFEADRAMYQDKRRRKSCAA